MPGCIYGILDADDEVRYVGQTQQTMKARLGRHFLDARGNPRSPFHKWLRDHIDEITVVFFEDAIDDLDAAEIRWIAYGRKLGWPLLNVL